MEYTKKRAELYGHLASIPSLRNLRDSEKLKLVEDVRGLGFPLLSLFSKAGTKVTAKRHASLISSWGVGRPVPVEWHALWEVHSWARRLIKELLDKGRVDLQPFIRQLPVVVSLTLDKETYAVREGMDAKILYKEIFLDLVRTLRQSPFPFRLCPLCKTIFVPVKRQKFCSPRCATKGLPEESKKQRREYMKRYMAQKRSNDKKKKQRGIP